jgi:nicotinate-nucleotide adenylyltransferase
MEMGCVPGETIKVEQIAPLGDPISISVSGYNLSLRLDEAENIFVEEISYEYHRLYLIQISIEGESHLKASDIEFRLPRPSYTADTLAYLQEKYPDFTFVIIMGSDSFQNLPKWKNYGFILKNYPIYIYIRPGYEILPEYPDARTLVLDAPEIPISATRIREHIREGKSIRYLVTEAAREEIEKNGYYRPKDL